MLRLSKGRSERGISLILLCCHLDKLVLVWQVIVERSEPAATRMHLWLERTAFYKVPKSHQDEVAEECHKPFEQVKPSQFLHLHIANQRWFL